MKALDTGDKAAESLEEPSEESVTVEAGEPDPEEPAARERGHVPADDQVNVYDLPPSDPGQGDNRG